VSSFFVILSCLASHLIIPFRTSATRGWYLMSLCLGCFPPSEKFEKYLENYIISGPNLSYTTFCWSRLQNICRQKSHPCRNSPPTGIELTAARVSFPFISFLFSPFFSFFLLLANSYLSPLLTKQPQDQVLIPIAIATEDGKRLEVQVHPSMLVVDVLEAAIRQSNLKHPAGFSLYRNGEICFPICLWSPPPKLIYSTSLSLFHTRSLPCLSPNLLL